MHPKIRKSWLYPTCDRNLEKILEIGLGKGFIMALGTLEEIDPICSNLNQLVRADPGGFSILGFTKTASEWKVLLKSAAGSTP
jgi:hypothetical protein